MVSPDSCCYAVTCLCSCFLLSRSRLHFSFLRRRCSAPLWPPRSSLSPAGRQRFNDLERAEFEANQQMLV